MGEILDEYDETPVASGMESGTSGARTVPGDSNISEVNAELDLVIPEEDYTTVGGFVFGVLGRLPVVGDRVTAAGATFTVKEMDGRRIRVLSIEVGRESV